METCLHADCWPNLSVAHLNIEVGSTKQQEQRQAAGQPHIQEVVSAQLLDLCDNSMSGLQRAAVRVSLVIDACLQVLGQRVLVIKTCSPMRATALA